MGGASGAAAASVGAGGVVTLTNDTNSAFNFGSDAHAEHFFNADGTVDERDNFGVNTQINSGTDWVIPNSAAPGSYRIRHTSAVGDTGAFTPAGVLNTYIALTSNRIYRVTDTTTVFGGQSVTYGIEIDDGSVSQDTGSFTLTADREDF
jgi:hypothetical protein